MTRSKGSGVTRARPEPTSTEPFSWTGKHWKTVFHGFSTGFPRVFVRGYIIAHMPCHFLLPRYRESGKWKSLPLHLPVRPDLPEGRSGLPWQVWSKSRKTNLSRTRGRNEPNRGHTKLRAPWWKTGSWAWSCSCLVLPGDQRLAVSSLTSINVRP
jgi:hypothetical protein